MADLTPLELGLLAAISPPSPVDTPFAAFGRRYWADPRGFVHDCIEGATATPYQDELLDAVPLRRRVAVRGPHGFGKSTTNAWLVWWFALTREACYAPVPRELGGSLVRCTDWKVVTTAGGYRQLEKYLWPEVHKWGACIRWDRVGREPLRKDRELLTQSIKLGHGEAFAVASDDAQKVEGAHADQILGIFDEAKSIAGLTFDAMEGAFSGAGDGRDAFAVTTSTPGADNGRFFEIHNRRKGLEDWWPRHVTLEEAIAAKRIGRAWAEQRRKLWGEQSALYQNRVLGNFASNANSRKVIQVADVERAVERGYELLDRLVPGTDHLETDERWRLAIPKLGQLTAISLDVGHGGLGRDPAAIARLYGHVVPPIEMPPPARDMYATEMDLVGRISAAAEGTGAGVICDAIGAAGLVGRLRELKVDVTPFVASSRSTARAKTPEIGFYNKRAEMIYTFGEMLHEDDADFVLPDDPTLIGELCEPEMIGLTSDRKIQIEGKDEIAKRLRGRDDREDEGFSTNRADGVWMLRMRGAPSTGLRVHQPAPREPSVF